MAEYDALVLGMKLAIQLKVRRLVVFSDSQLVVEQVGQGLEVKDPILQRYAGLVQQLKGKFKHFEIQKISRTEKTQADALSKFALAIMSKEKLTFVEVFKKPSFEHEETLQISNDGPNWMTDIKNFMTGAYVPSDPKETTKLNRRKTRFKLEDGVLHERSYYRPLLKCLSPREAAEAIKKLHDGDGAAHIGGQAMVIQLIRQGFYWPTMKENVFEFTKKCEKCQMHGDSILQQTRELSLIVVPWPFAQ